VQYKYCILLAFYIHYSLAQLFDRSGHCIRGRILCNTLHCIMGIFFITTSHCGRHMMQAIHGGLLVEIYCNSWCNEK
jgi:hypothetical protein